MTGNLNIYFVCWGYVQHCFSLTNIRLLIGRIIYTYFRISKEDHENHIAALDKEEAELEEVKFLLILSWIMILIIFVS